MSSRLLRTIRIISLVLIFLLGGFYASTYVRMERDVADHVETSSEWTTTAGTLPEFSLPDLRGNTRSISEWSGLNK